MFKRLFGSKGKGGANASAEQAGEVAAVDKTEQCVQSMQEIRSTITQLEDKYTTDFFVTLLELRF